MKMQSASEPKVLSVEEKAERVWSAIKPMVARAIEKNNIRGGAKLDDLEANSGAVGDALRRALTRALMETGILEFARATDEEVAETRTQALKKAKLEVASKFKPEDLRVVQMNRVRTMKTKRGPVRCRREYLYFPDLAVGIFPPRHTA